MADMYKSMAYELVVEIRARLGVITPRNIERHIAILERMHELIGAEVEALRCPSSDDYEYEYYARQG